MSVIETLFYLNSKNSNNFFKLKILGWVHLEWIQFYSVSKHNNSLQSNKEGREF